MAAEACRVDPSVARKSVTLILQKFAELDQRPVAKALDKSDTWVSRWVSNDLKVCADLLSALGLKVVPASNVCFPPEYVKNLQFFAQIGIKQDAPVVLDWGDNQ
jgi:hypothetical protein